MKRYRLAASLVLAVLGVLALAGPVAAGKQVPFKGSLEGDVTVTSASEEVVLRAGDFVRFPRGLRCTWHIRQSVRKHYHFG